MFDFGKKIYASIESLIAVLNSLITTVPALLTTTIQEDLFIQGKSFSYEDYHLFSQDEEKFFIFNPLNCTCDQIVVSPVIFSATSGPVLIDYFFGMTSQEDGELLGSSNRRATSENINQATVRLNPTISDNGTRISGDLIPSTGVAAPNFSGAESPTGLPFEITLTNKWGVKITNTDGDDVYIGIKITWFEI